MEKELVKFDANKNGKLEQAEHAALRADRTQRQKEAVKKWDKNKDGKLDENELAAARVAWRKALKEEKTQKAAKEKKN